MSTHWPSHFFLVSPGGMDQGQRPTVETLGAKAYNLWRMSRIGLPVPAAVVIGTHFTGKPGECMVPLFTRALPTLEKDTGRCFGDRRNPLLVSVRSGSVVSMPGMMDTLLNIGLCDDTAQGLLRQTGNPRLVWDAYRRLIASFAEVVAGVPAEPFDEALQALTQGRDERLLDFSELRELSRRYLAIYAEAVGEPFPQDPHDQLAGAVKAVFHSWHSTRAKEYRRLHGIDDKLGTAVTIQRMVFGNSGVHAGSGVGFTRDPSNGEPTPWVDFLANAQGEDVVSGRRNAHGHASLELLAPAAWQSLVEATAILEREFGDMQDFEFTIEEGRLYLLQTRAGKRTPLAAARIAFDLLDEHCIDAHTALERTAHLRESELGDHAVVAEDGQPLEALAAAISACPGVVSGEIALDEQRVRERVAAGRSVILVRKEADTGDLPALGMAQGLLTACGARTSHAAVVARQLGVTYLVGCRALTIDSAGRRVRFAERCLGEGDLITLDGTTGNVYPGVLSSVYRPHEALIQRLRALRASGARLSDTQAS